MNQRLQIKTKDVPLATVAALAEAKKKLEATIAALKVQVEAGSAYAALLDKRRHLQAEVEALQADLEGVDLATGSEATAKETKPTDPAIIKGMAIALKQCYENDPGFRALCGHPDPVTTTKQAQPDAAISEMFAWFRSPMFGADWQGGQLRGRMS